MTLVQTELKSMKIWKQSRLPAEYQEVEYIQSSGTQYIDTGHKHTANSKVELKLSCQSVSSQRNCIFGSRQNSTASNAFGIGAQYSSKIWASVGGYDNAAIANISADTIYEISLSKDNFTINGISTSLTTNLTSYSYNDLLFGMNENGNVNPYSRVSAKMYYCKIYESNTLVRDMIPCYRKLDSVIGMYDLVNDVFYTNSGTGTFNKGNNTNGGEIEIKKVTIRLAGRLPAGYQEVEYIQTTGTQWIDTGIFAYNNYQTETKIEVTTTSQNISIFGTINSSNTYNHTYYHLTPFNNSWYFGTNNVEGHGGTYSNVIGTKYEIVYNNSNSYLNVNGTDIVSVSGTVGAPGSTLAISRRGGGTYANNGVYKYFYFKVYDKTNSEYVLDLVPCYRTLDNVIGMYDIVNDVFYTNSGTGTFTKGANIGGEKQIRPVGGLPAEYQEVEYIESSGTQYIATLYNIEEGHIYKSKFRALSGNLYWKTFGGHYGNSSSNRFFTGICEDNGQPRWGYAFGNDMNYTFGTPSLGVDYEAEVKLSNGSQYFILDGTELYARNFSFSSSTQHTVAVLASTETNNSMSIWGATRLYYWQLYDTSNNLQLDLIPCYRKLDSVIGMYDLVNDQFYTNSGSGTFTKGPDVN